jgi:hypothetical protein
VALEYFHTDELQPFYRVFFGAIKATFRRRFEEPHAGQPVMKPDVMDILAAVWEELSLHSIRRGWPFYEDDFGPEDDGADYAE